MPSADEHLAALLAGPSLPEIAKALGIKPGRGGYLVTMCDRRYSVPYCADRPVVWPTLERACEVAFGYFIATPPNPFTLGQRIILDWSMPKAKGGREILFGQIEHFTPRNSLGIGIDPRGWGHNGDCKCTFQLPQGGFMGGTFDYERLKLDPDHTPFTNPMGEEHAIRLETWVASVQSALAALREAALTHQWFPC